MKVYISGKITGLNYDDVVAKFEESERVLIAMGHTPINPVKLVPFNESWAWEDYMKADIKILMDCDGIYMQSDFLKSTGAEIERRLSRELNFKVFHQDEN